MICNTRIAGRYKLKVYRPDGSVRQETDWFDNLITNNGMEQFRTAPGASAALCTQCYIGRSANKPLVTDTQLGSIIATSNSVAAPVYTFFDGDEAYWRAYKIFTFNAGNATGDVREVAVGYTTTNLFSRSLVQGVAEVPITISVLADEKLEVYYERRNYIDKTDKTIDFGMANSATLSGFDGYLATIRASDIDVVPDLFSGFGPTGLSGVVFRLYEQKTLGTVYQAISSSPAAPNIATVAPYIPNSHYSDYTFQYDPTAAVFSGGIGTAMFTSTQGRFQMLFNPYIPKTNRYRLRFAVRHSWSRYVPAL